MDVSESPPKQTEPSSAATAEPPFELFVDQILGMCELLNGTAHWAFSPRDAFRAWIRNFDESDRWLAAVLLDKLTAISTAHQTECLRQSLQDWLLAESAELAPFTSPIAKRDALRLIVRETCITPVQGETPNPSDSGNAVCREVRYLLGDKAGVVDLATAIQHAKVGHRVVLVDDCVGSGSQVWSTLKREIGGISLASCLLDTGRCRIALIGTIGDQNTLEDLERSGVRCFFAYRLGSGDPILEAECEPHYPIRDDAGLRTQIAALLHKYAPRIADDAKVRVSLDAEFALYGYRRFAHTIAIPRQFPDWSLPIYWATTTQWDGIRLEQGL